MLRKPYWVLSNAQLQYILSCQTHTPNSLSAQPWVRSTKHYATFTEAPPQDTTDDYIWPRSTISNSNPTPYDILQVKRNAPYTKHCYYRLVKIYHPDRDTHISNSSTTASALPRHIRIERYRLVVAAHEILSDPVKRKAYDTYGKGWAATHSGGPGWPREKRSRHGRRGGQNQWTGFDSPFANATWEDWEKWYERQHGKQPPQEPVYISNTGFVLTVMGAVVIGAVGQRMNVGSHEQFFREQADKSHEKASSYFKERMLGAENAADRPEQIRRFLRHREQNGYSGPELVEERKALPPPPSTSGTTEETNSDDHG